MQNSKFLLLVICAVSCSLHAQVPKGLFINGERAYNLAGQAVCMPDANTIAIGESHHDEKGTNSGHVKVYQWLGGSWLQKGDDIDGEAATDYSGEAISMPDANTIAIGATSNDGNGTEAGHVRVYRWFNGAWIKKGADIDGEGESDFSGWSISMPDANTIAVSAPYRNGRDLSDLFSGQVKVYEWLKGMWIQKGKNINGEGGDFLGWSLSMPDKNTVAVSGPGGDGNGENSGYVRIYSWSGTGKWVQKGAIINGENKSDGSGESVSMPDANTVAIGAPKNDGNKGHVRVYHWLNGAWTQKGTDIDGEGKEDYSGRSVSMPNASTIAIGAARNDLDEKNTGYVKLYRWLDSTWVQKGATIRSNEKGDLLGWSVSMPDANTVSTGAPENDANGERSGQAQVYVLSSSCMEEGDLNADGLVNTGDLVKLLSLGASYTPSFCEPGSSVLESGTCYDSKVLMTIFFNLDRTCDQIANSGAGKKGVDPIAFKNWMEQFIPTHGEEIFFYPNPSNGILNIKGFEQVTQLNILNYLGQVVFEGEAGRILDLSHLKAGVYFINLKTEGKQKLHRKIVIR